MKKVVWTILKLLGMLFVLLGCIKHARSLTIMTFVTNNAYFLGAAIVAAYLFAAWAFAVIWKPLRGGAGRETLWLQVVWFLLVFGAVISGADAGKRMIQHLPDPQALPQAVGAYDFATAIVDGVIMAVFLSIISIVRPTVGRMKSAG